MESATTLPKRNNKAIIAVASLLVISVLSILRSPIRSIDLRSGNSRNAYFTTEAHHGSASIDANGHDMSDSTTIHVPIQPPPSLDIDARNASSACLIWMDDSQRLVEWIAYQYYTFSLRTLIIFRDPKSTQHLEPIVRRWEGLMEIKVWQNQTQFIADKNQLLRIQALERAVLRTADPEQRGTRDYTVHLRNQAEFYRGCAMHLQENNRTWTMFIDTDEFIVFRSDEVANVSQRLSQPGSVFNLLQLIQQRQAMGGESQFEGKCVTLLRLQYSPMESPDEHVRRGVPDFLDPYRFQTLRFRHTEGQKYFGKAIGDVSRLHFAKRKISTHQLLLDQCPSAWGQQHDILRINHYIGSYESFLNRNDRRDKMENRTDKWHDAGNRSIKNPGPPCGDEARSWIQGFVEHFGVENTKRLLHGAGSPYNPDTAMQRIELPCGDDCLSPYDPRGPLLRMIERTALQSEAP